MSSDDAHVSGTNTPEPSEGEETLPWADRFALTLISERPASEIYPGAFGNCTNPDFRDESRRVFIAHAKDPYYPRALKVPELIAQVEALRSHELTDLANQFGGGGKLKSQFMNYIRQCSCACWPSWRAAWTDFAVFMQFDQNVTTEEANSEPYWFDGTWR